VGLIVVDASAIVELLIAQDEPRRAAVAARVVGGSALYAPDYLDVEVVSAMRGIARVNPIVAQDGPALLKQLTRMPIRREQLSEVALQRVWQLRDNMTTYDAGYVALAELLGATVLTTDAKFTGPPRLGCAIEVIR
jgi:predicted nucleic acid-binding protein